MALQRDQVLCRLNLFKSLSRKEYSNSTETLIINHLKNTAPEEKEAEAERIEDLTRSLTEKELVDYLMKLDPTLTTEDTPTTPDHRVF